MCHSANVYINWNILNVQIVWILIFIRSTACYIFEEEIGKMNKCKTCDRYPRPVVGNSCRWCGCCIYNQQKQLMHAKKCSRKPMDCDGVLFCLCQQMKRSEEDAQFILQHTMARWQRMRARICWSSLTVPITSPFQGYPIFPKTKTNCVYWYECVCLCECDEC